MRLDDWRPHLLRTRDGGKTWTEIVDGIAGGTTRVIREDPKTRGLLFAGTEQTVFVSFDDGDHWQSLRINMPATSIRDLVVHDDDLIAGTHGRGFWVLDDIEPLRQAKSTSALLRPARAWRVRGNMNTDTPFPPDEPGGPNPPDGAVIDYVLPSAAKSVKISILNGSEVIRTFDSADKVEPPKDSGNIPWYWIRPQRVPSTAAGMHRFVWDLHYTPLPGKPQYPIAATPYDTPPAPSSPWVMPGNYTVQLTVDGQTMSAPLTVAMDPRVKSSNDALAQQFKLSKELYDAIGKLNAAIGDVRTRRDAAKGAKSGESALDALLGAQGENDFPPQRPAPGQPPTLNSVATTMRALMSAIESADVAPTPALARAVEEMRKQFGDVMKRYEALPR
jgi:hypothetical protein